MIHTSLKALSGSLSWVFICHLLGLWGQGFVLFTFFFVTCMFCIPPAHVYRIRSGFCFRTEQRCVLFHRVWQQNWTTQQAKLLQHIPIRKEKNVFTDETENIIVEVYSWHLGAILSFERSDCVQKEDHTTRAWWAAFPPQLELVGEPGQCLHETDPSQTSQHLLNELTQYTVLEDLQYTISSSAPISALSGHGIYSCLGIHHLHSAFWWPEGRYGSYNFFLSPLTLHCLQGTRN